VGQRPTDNAVPGGWARLDLDAIGRVIGAIPEPRAPAGDEVRRFQEGYRYVDALLAERTDIFAYGQSRHLLELNHRVLCGVTPERRRQFAAHVAATERRFYDGGEEGGYGEMHAWYPRHHGRPTRTLAAGAFVETVSSPQLFVEGNQRTAILLASYLLARGGLPPVVVRPEDWPRLETISDRVAPIDRTGLAAGITLTFAGQRVNDFFTGIADPRFLLARAAAEGGSP
jgi:hypothetical protein